jgi:hypothetical protein
MGVVEETTTFVQTSLFRVSRQTVLTFSRTASTPTHLPRSSLSSERVSPTSNSRKMLTNYSGSTWILVSFPFIVHDISTGSA